MTPRLVRRLLGGVAAVLAGCGGSRGNPSSLAPVMPPLASFASVRMIAMPAQLLRASDTLWLAKVGPAKAFLASIDAAIEASLRERGLGSMWAFPSDLVRTARRNPMYSLDPATIRAADAVRVMERRPGSDTPEPVASQLRALAGFHDARHALVPVEVRLEVTTAPGGGVGGGGAPSVQLVMHVAVLDVRSARLVWIGDVAGNPAPAFSAALAADLARRFADLIVER